MHHPNEPTGGGGLGGGREDSAPLKKAFPSHPNPLKNGGPFRGPPSGGGPLGRSKMVAGFSTPDFTAVNTLRDPPTGRGPSRPPQAAYRAGVDRALGESAGSGLEISDHCADLCRRVDGPRNVQRSRDRPLPGLTLGHLFS